MTVSSVVHLAARRAALAADRAEEARTLLVLARAVLGGADTARAIVYNLCGSLGVTAELLERSGGRWVRVAGTPLDGAGLVVPAGPDVRLCVSGDVTDVSRRVLDGYAAQAAAALDRERLRTQTAQAEALAAGNRMQAALLTAVSHDLRTPLASVKAAVSTLQTDVTWSTADQAELMATIEEGTDRLDGLIANLLDITRLVADP